jgi:hypothetical protein
VEVDLVIEENQKIKLYEIKSSNTMNEKFFSSMTKVANLANVSVEDTNVIYAGDKTFPANSFHGGYISWKDW